MKRAAKGCRFRSRDVKITQITDNVHTLSRSINQNYRKSTKTAISKSITERQIHLQVV